MGWEAYKRWESFDESDGEEAPIEVHRGPSEAALRKAREVVARTSQAKKLGDAKGKSAFVRVAAGDDLADLDPVFLGDPGAYEAAKVLGVATHWGLDGSDAARDKRERRRLSSEFLYRGSVSPERQFVRALMARKRAALEKRARATEQDLEICVRVCGHGSRGGSPIWRQLRISGSLSLAQLHDVLVPAVGWCRELRRGYWFMDYGDGATWCPHDDLDAAGAREAAVAFVEGMDPRATAVGNVLVEAGDALGYTYDPEAQWAHEVCLVKAHSAPRSCHGARLLDGACRCPDEGGRGNDAYEAQVLKPWVAAGHAVDGAAPPRFAVGRRVTAEAPLEDGAESSAADEVLLGQAPQPWITGVVAATGVDQDGATYAYAIAVDDAPAGAPPLLVLFDSDDSVKAVDDDPPDNQATAARQLYDACRRRDAAPNVPPGTRFDPGDFDLHRHRAQLRAALRDHAKPRDDRVCARCGSPRGLQTCAACKSLAYCSRDCHRADWPVHKPECQRRVRERNAPRPR